MVLIALVLLRMFSLTCFPITEDTFQTDVNGFIKSDLFETVDAPQAGDIIIFKAHQGAVNHIGIVVSDKLWIGAHPLCHSSCPVELI